MNAGVVAVITRPLVHLRGGMVKRSEKLLTEKLRNSYSKVTFNGHT